MKPSELASLLALAAMFPAPEGEFRIAEKKRSEEESKRRMEAAEEKRERKAAKKRVLDKRI